MFHRRWVDRVREVYLLRSTQPGRTFLYDRQRMKPNFTEVLRKEYLPPSQLETTERQVEDTEQTYAAGAPALLHEETDYDSSLGSVVFEAPAMPGARLTTPLVQEGSSGNNEKSVLSEGPTMPGAWADEKNTPVPAGVFSGL
jgi:hypothetical protein